MEPSLSPPVQPSAPSIWVQVWRSYKYFLIALLVVLVDQVVKFIVKFNMVEGEAIPILGETFQINYVENPGAAFGLTLADIFSWIGVEMTAETAKVILTLFSLMATIVIAWLIRQLWEHRSALPFFLALILGGALGNIVDRVFYGVWFDAMNSYDGGLLHGRVVDMFYLDLYQGEFLGIHWNLLPVFNLADAAISIGILAILIFQGKFSRRHQRLLNAASTSEGQAAG